MPAIVKEGGRHFKPVWQVDSPDYEACLESYSMARRGRDGQKLSRAREFGANSDLDTEHAMARKTCFESGSRSGDSTVIKYRRKNSRADVPASGHKPNSRRFLMALSCKNVSIGARSFQHGPNPVRRFRLALHRAVNCLNISTFVYP